MSCFVFVCAPHAETMAQELISDLGYKTWLPVEKRLYRRLRGKPVVRENPLFPRYGFVWWAPGADYGPILRCKGVQDVLPNRVNPVPVSEHLIEGLKLAETVGVFDHTRPPRVGTRVEVMEGPFAGMIGKIARARAADRVKVMLKILSSVREVEVPLMALREV